MNRIHVAAAFGASASPVGASPSSASFDAFSPLGSLPSVDAARRSTPLRLGITEKKAFSQLCVSVNRRRISKTWFMVSTFRVFMLTNSSMGSRACAYPFSVAMEWHRPLWWLWSMRPPKRCVKLQRSVYLTQDFSQHLLHWCIIEQLHDLRMEQYVPIM